MNLVIFLICSVVIKLMFCNAIYSTHGKTSGIVSYLKIINILIMMFHFLLFLMRYISVPIM